jgi:hypothetical protein
LHVPFGRGREANSGSLTSNPLLLLWISPFQETIRGDAARNHKFRPVFVNKTVVIAATDIDPSISFQPRNDLACVNLWLGHLDPWFSAFAKINQDRAYKYTISCYSTG